MPSVIDVRDRIQGDPARRCRGVVAQGARRRRMRPFVHGERQDLGNEPEGEALEIGKIHGSVTLEAPGTNPVAERGRVASCGRTCQTATTPQSV